jgi:2-hydroxychromene-2-carboxylate isomerase
MAGPALDFWFDFASTYSYLAAMRIGPLAEQAGLRVRFRPFLLGPIFKAQGWTTSQVLKTAQSDEIKTRLRAQTEEAQRLGLFGAPSFTTSDGELFWGNDRLEQAVRWQKRITSSE